MSHIEDLIRNFRKVITIAKQWLVPGLIFAKANGFTAFNASNVIVSELDTLKVTALDSIAS